MEQGTPMRQKFKWPASAFSIERIGGCCPPCFPQRRGRKVQCNQDLAESAATPAHHCSTPPGKVSHTKSDRAHRSPTRAGPKQPATLPCPTDTCSPCPAERRAPLMQT